MALAPLMAGVELGHPVLEALGGAEQALDERGGGRPPGVARGAMTAGLSTGALASTRTPRAAKITLTGKATGVELSLMFGSPGPAETAAVKSTAAAWPKATHNQAGLGAYPTTWSQLAADAKALTKNGAAGLDEPS